MSIWERLGNQHADRSEEREPPPSGATAVSYIVGVDLGQASDYTAISIVERVAPPLRPIEYRLRYLHRPALGTKYPRIANEVLALFRPPLSDTTPLVVDKTGVGAAVVDLFAERGRTPVAVTITGGDTVNRQDAHDLRVPKRDLATTLVALFQTGRLKVAEGLPLAPVLVNELVNFKVKINAATGHDSYEAWREAVHDDLVLSVALACWYGEHEGGASVWLL